MRGECPTGSYLLLHTTYGDFVLHTRVQTQRFHVSMTQKNNSHTLNVNYNLLMPNQLINSQTSCVFVCFFPVFVLFLLVKVIKQCCICSGEWDTKYVLKDKCRPTTFCKKKREQACKTCILKQPVQIKWAHFSALQFPTGTNPNGLHPHVGRTDHSEQSDNDIRGICGLSQSVNYLATPLKSMKSIKEWLNQMKTAENPNMKSMG